MQPTGFGKKGLPDGDMAARRAAFIAAERQGAPDPHPTEPMSPADSVRYAEQKLPPRQGPDKSLFVAYLCWFLLGQLSAHRFYLGAYRSAFIQTGFIMGGILIVVIEGSSKSASGVLLGIIPMFIGMGWVLLDAFLIPGLKTKMEHEARQRDYSAAFS